MDNNYKPKNICILSGTPHEPENLSVIKTRFSSPSVCCVFTHVTAFCLWRWSILVLLSDAFSTIPPCPRTPVLGAAIPLFDL